jgi:hypothetical protein
MYLPGILCVFSSAHHLQSNPLHGGVAALDRPPKLMLTDRLARSLRIEPPDLVPTGYLAWSPHARPLELVPQVAMDPSHGWWRRERERSRASYYDSEEL